MNIFSPSLDRSFVVTTFVSVQRTRDGYNNEIPWKNNNFERIRISKRVSFLSKIGYIYSLKKKTAHFWLRGLIFHFQEHHWIHSELNFQWLLTEDSSNNIFGDLSIFLNTSPNEDATCYFFVTEKMRFLKRYKKVLRLLSDKPEKYPGRSEVSVRCRGHAV